jgi:hypothetical protein
MSLPSSSPGQTSSNGPWSSVSPLYALQEVFTVFSYAKDEAISFTVPHVWIVRDRLHEKNLRGPNSLRKLRV